MKAKLVNERKLIFDDKGIMSFAMSLKKRLMEGIMRSHRVFESGLLLSQIGRMRLPK